jgi:hypothetical protein
VRCRLNRHGEFGASVARRNRMVMQVRLVCPSTHEAIDDRQFGTRRVERRSIFRRCGRSVPTSATKARASARRGIQNCTPEPFDMRPRLTRGTCAWAALVAALASVPTLWVGFVGDDLLQRLMLEHRLPGFGDGFWRSYEFTPQSLPTSEQVTRGLLPWFTDPELRIRFFRPLTSASLAMDAWCFGRNAALARRRAAGSGGLPLPPWSARVRWQAPCRPAACCPCHCSGRPRSLATRCGCSETLPAERHGLGVWYRPLRYCCSARCTWCSHRWCG